MEIRDIYFPVTKIPVPPDVVDLIRIVLLDTSFQQDEEGNIEQFQKFYFETTLEGKKVDDGNGIIPTRLVPLILDPKNNAQFIAAAIKNYGYVLIHEVFNTMDNVFKNPYTIQINNELNILENGRTTDNPTIAAEPIGTTESAQPSPADSSITPPN